MNAEDRFCSDCGFADYCMRERSCYRRDAGEIRSPYSESARGDLTPSAQPDAGATSSSSDAPRPESFFVLEARPTGRPAAIIKLVQDESPPLSLRAAFRINYASTLPTPSSFDVAQDEGVEGSLERAPCEAHGADTGAKQS